MVIKNNGVNIVAIVGPTASGKSSLGVKIAKKFNGEIISADSRQVYKGLNIGSGKITDKEMRGIKHYLLDIMSPRKIFTVNNFQKLGKKAIQIILAKNKSPIIVGGAGFYIDVLINDTQLPEVEPNLELRKELEKLNTETLFQKLSELDPDRAITIDAKNKRRLVRAIEIITATGKPVEKISTNKQLHYQTLKIGIKIPEEKLKDNIRKRLIRRIKQGMVAEIKSLHKKGVSWKRLDDLGLEYRWVSRYLRGMIVKKEMIEILEKEIWYYAKRQMTWFKRDKKIHWISDPKRAALLIQRFLLNHELVQDFFD